MILEESTHVLDYKVSWSSGQFQTESELFVHTHIGRAPGLFSKFVSKFNWGDDEIELPSLDEHR